MDGRADPSSAQAAGWPARLLPLSLGERAGLIGILAVAGFVRFFRLSPGLFDDEVYSLDVANHGLGTILRILQRTDTHPPLSYFLLHFWIRAFGSSEVAVRSLSALFGIGTVWMLYLLGRLLWDSSTGLIAALLLALSDFNVQYSHNARMYTLMTFLATASFYFFARLCIAPGRSTVVLYLLSSAALIYTHVWGVFLVAAQTVVVAAFLLTREPAQRARIGLRWLMLQAGLVVLWCPWLLFGFRRQVETTLHDKGTAFGNLALYRAPTTRDVLKGVYFAANTNVLALLFVAVVGVAVSAHVISAGRSEPRSTSSTTGRVGHALLGAAREAIRDLRLVLLGAWLVVPLLTATALSYLVTPVFLPRYTIAVSLPVYLAVAAGLTRLRNKALSTVALTGIVVLAAVSVGRYVSSLSDFFRAPAEYVAAHAAPRDLVLYDMPGIVFDHYAHRSDLEGTYIRPHQDDRAFIKLLAGHRDAIDPAVRNPFVLDTEATDLQVLAAATRYKRVWLLIGPQFPGQLREETAIGTLRKAFGHPGCGPRSGSSTSSSLRDTLRARTSLPQDACVGPC
jgi:mannosyltransferase